MKDGGDTDCERHPDSLNRRSFLTKLSGATGAVVAVGVVGLPPLAGAKEVGPERLLRRRADALAKREDAGTAEAVVPPFHPTNGDEKHYGSKIGNYSKGLVHISLGEVDQETYESLVSALATGASTDLEAIDLGGTLKLSNPQASHAHSLEGADSHTGLTLVSPKFASHEQGSEMAECYWMALVRDVAFADFEANSLVASAIRDLGTFAGY